MHFNTIHEWDESLWTDAERIYVQAFPEHSRKKKPTIKKMFKKSMCFLHFAFIENEMVGMALSGKVEKADVLILDYIAVKKDVQSHGIGSEFIQYIKAWSHKEECFNLLVVEVEADKNAINAKRIRFWEKVGFQLTDYIHRYIWVPEKYCAMYYSFHPSKDKNISGEMLFSYITEFHKKGYRGR